MAQIYVIRKPIFDRNLKTVYYELLYRQGNCQPLNFGDGDDEVSALLSRTLIEIGLERIAGQRLVFMNLGRNFIIGKTTMPLDKARMGLQIGSELDIDRDIAVSLQRLSQAGYPLILDRIMLPQDLSGLMKYVTMAKLSVCELEQTELLDQLSLFATFPHVQLIAHGVSTRREFEIYRQLGFHYFQGPFLAKRNLAVGYVLDSNRANVLRLLAQVQDPAVSVDGLEEIIRADADLGVKLLRYINSATFNLARKFNSIRDVIGFLGLKQLRVWVSLIVLSGVQNQSTELTSIALVRGKMCELLAMRLSESDIGRFFAVGLFSVMDVLLEMPMAEVLKSLPLSEEIKAALHHHHGRLGEILVAVTEYEQIRFTNNVLGLSAIEINDIYAEALVWAEGSLAALQS